MCGIALIIDKVKKEVSREQMGAMIEAVKHRGPEGSHILIDGQVGLAHSRLRIIDPHERADQPFAYMDRYVISHNGEVYNHEQLRRELIDLGYEFRTLTDAEVILAAYDQWGNRCVHRFEGMWSFIIWDKKMHKIFASRDRYGVKPLYFMNGPQQFSIASEIKQFCGLSDWSGSPNLEHCLLFLKYGMHDNNTNTLFDGISQLRGGENLIYDIKKGTVTVDYYYQAGSYGDRIDSNTDKTFAALLEKSVEHRLIGEGALGMSLSGGIDSSAIAYISAAQNRSNNIPPLSNFHLCSKDNPYDELEYAKKISHSLDAAFIPVWFDFEKEIKRIDNLLWHQDEPIPTASILAQSCVFEAAKSHGIKIMLDGQGSDEILCGYDTFLWNKMRSSWLRNPIDTIITFLFIARYRRRNFREKLRFSTHDFSPWFSKDSGMELDIPFRSETKSLKGRSIELLKGQGLPVLLHYLDRNSMTYSIESRPPFLHHEFVEFCLELPDDVKIKNGLTKYILRKYLKGKIPELIRKRKDKIAFHLPEDKWILRNTNLFKKEITELLNDYPQLFNTENKQIEGLFNSPSTPQIAFIWRLFTFSRWRKIFNLNI